MTEPFRMVDASKKDHCGLCGALLDKDLDGQLSCLGCGYVKSRASEKNTRGE